MTDLHLTVNGASACGKSGGSIPPSMLREVTCEACIDTVTYRFARSAEFVRNYGVDTIKDTSVPDAPPEKLVEEFTHKYPDLIVALKGGRIVLPHDEIYYEAPKWKW